MKASAWKAIIRIVLALVLALLGKQRKLKQTPAKRSAANKNKPVVTDDQAIARLFVERRSDVIVTAAGRVVKILRDDLDDTDGSGMHQQFLVDVDGTDFTVKISHNLKFGRAPVQEGDRVRFKGEYEWNDRGDCVHWTHHDPKGWHEDGWLEHEGKRYE
jgi:hypothetical protein